mmetsp:Transcript_2571/g.10763  ORF Transcript_2571/g.10763 Transcript_2571/m.10763 type:complete len:274 (-) Transcript_2571:1972-2793(-)
MPILHGFHQQDKTDEDQCIRPDGEDKVHHPQTDIPRQACGEQGEHPLRREELQRQADPGQRLRDVGMQKLEKRLQEPHIHLHSDHAWHPVVWKHVRGEADHQLVAKRLHVPEHVLRQAICPPRLAPSGHKCGLRPRQLAKEEERDEVHGLAVAHFWSAQGEGTQNPAQGSPLSGAAGRGPLNIQLDLCECRCRLAGLATKLRAHGRIGFAQDPVIDVGLMALSKTLDRSTDPKPEEGACVGVHGDLRRAHTQKGSRDARHRISKRQILRVQES